MKNLSIISILILLVFASQVVFAQGPPPPPPPASGVPFDGGIITFLVLALFGGAKFLSKKK